MIGRWIMEIMVLWICYGAYMAVLVHRKGPVGAIFFYPPVMQERVIELGLMSRETMKKRRAFAHLLLLGWMLVVPFFLMVYINHANSYWDYFWQYYVMFISAEFFDWLFIDTIWVALSDWWIIPGTEDLNHTWHSVEIKKWKWIRLFPVAVPIAAIVAGLYWLVTLI